MDNTIQVASLWRDIDPMEDKVYNMYIQAGLAAKYDKFKDLKVYGTKTGDSFNCR